MVTGSVSKVEVSWDDALHGNFPVSPGKRSRTQGLRIMF
jgi:hypothetical protein